MNSPKYLLFSAHSTVPIPCNRDDWKACPDHQYLSDKMPDIKPPKWGEAETGGLSFENDPNDGITSISEYNDFLNSEDKVYGGEDPSFLDKHPNVEATANVAGGAFIIGSFAFPPALAVVLGINALAEYKEKYGSFNKKQREEHDRVFFRQDEFPTGNQDEPNLKYANSIYRGYVKQEGFSDSYNEKAYIYKVDENGKETLLRTFSGKTAFDEATKFGDYLAEQLQVEYLANNLKRLKKK